MKPLDDRGRDDLDGLRRRLQRALAIEHYTIPPYLYALCSIDPETNPSAWQALRLVLMEEMLHMALVGNLLNAVGGAPTLLAPGFVQRYPAAPPGSAGGPVLGLRKLSPESLASFARMEHPSSPGASTVQGATGVGRVVSVLLGHLSSLCERYGEVAVFCGDPSRQIAGHHYYGGRDRLLPITDHESARAALRTIVTQSEGASSWGEAARLAGDDDAALGHYHRFRALELGRRWAPADRLDGDPTGPADPVDWSAVRDLVPDPRAADYPPGSDARVALDACNATYRSLLATLHRAFHGEPDAVGDAVATMYELRYRAEALGRIPLGAGSARLGPSFEVAAAPPPCGPA